MSDVINIQPAIIRTLTLLSIKQDQPDGTFSYFTVDVVSAETHKLIREQASVLLPGVGYFAKRGNNFEWTARFKEINANQFKLHFVFNDYSNTQR